MPLQPVPVLKRSSDYLGLSWIHATTTTPTTRHAAWKVLQKEMKVSTPQTLHLLEVRNLAAAGIKAAPQLVNLTTKNSSVSIVSRSLQTHRHWGVTKMPIKRREWRRKDCSFKPERPASTLTYNLIKTCTTSVSIILTMAPILHLHGSMILHATLVIINSLFMKNLKLASIHTIKILMYQNGVVLLPYQLKLHFISKILPPVCSLGPTDPETTRLHSSSSPLLCLPRLLSKAVNLWIFS